MLLVERRLRNTRTGSIIELHQLFGLYCACIVFSLYCECHNGVKVFSALVKETWSKLSLSGESRRKACRRLLR